MFAYLAFACLPAPQITGHASLDGSWIWALNLANGAGLQFGRDIGFTYGPLGYLNAPIFPYANPRDFFIYVGAFYTLAVFSWIRIRRSKDLDTLPTNAMAFLFVTCHLLLAIYLWDQFEMAMCALAASILLRKPDGSESRKDLLATVFLAILTGVAPLLRLYQVFIGGALLLLVLWVKKDRTQWIVMPAIALAAYLALSQGKGIPLQAQGDFLKSSLEIVSGYSEGMAFLGPSWQVMLALGSIALLALLGFWASPAATPTALLIAVLAYKHGVVRQDAHMAPFHFKVASAVLIAWAASRKPDKWPFFAAMAGANLILGLFVGSYIFPFVAENAKMRINGTYQVAYLWQYLHFGDLMDELYTMRPKQLASRVIDKPARQWIGDSTVDIVPHYVDTIPANQFRWSPRPVFQSYSAYTPYLDAWNASHYRGPHKPEKLLLQWDPIDGRHPFLEDPLTWREILSRYRVEIDSNQGLVMGQNPGAETLGVETISSDPVRIDWDRWVEVPERSHPDRELIAAKIVTNPSLQGTFWTLAVRGTRVFIETEFADGRRGRYRTVRANLPSGPIFNPMPTSLEEARPLLSGDWLGAGNAVKRIRITTDKTDRFDAAIQLQWIRLVRRSRP